MTYFLIFFAGVLFGIGLIAVVQGRRDDDL